ncbi:MAG: FAD-binding protein [Candidatus Poseidoniia archaeon]|jgi:hypothetical protein|nr:FAD-binding protein [Candidatus Poseidoniia archaeon]MDP7444764.1 FAD-binding protein [Candidatus Poseidoniia archaeon]|tara:strand:+ start:1665 stop:3164 length:1500 start_codon:yes stop_codon:yes gene_type:complete
MKRREFFKSAVVSLAAVSYPSWKGYADDNTIPIEIPAVTGSRQPIAIERIAVEEFRKSLNGRLLLPEDDDYQVARLVRNRSIDKRPALIAQCRNSEDVQACVNFAHHYQLLTAVKCGAHSVSGKGTCDGGLLIDLSPLQGVSVNPTKRRIFVTGGSLLGRLDEATLPLGLGTTAGTVSHTGVGGLTLGGGFGRLGRRFGLTLDNLKSVEIVTADGQLRYADAEENSELFWGVRGGGGNFGVVTMFEFQLHPMNPKVVGGRITYSFSQVKDLLKFYGEHSVNAPVELYYDPVIFAPPMGFDKMVYFDVCYSGPLDQAEKVLKPLYSAGKVLKDNLETIDYMTLQKSGDDDDPRGASQYLKGGFITDVTSGLIDTLVDNLEAHPTRGSMAFFQQSGGAINEVPADTTAFPHRYANSNLITGSFWPYGVDTAPHIEWSRRYWRKVDKFTKGFYTVDEFSESQQQVNKNFLGNYDRLVKIKNQYDPTNLFRLNANIKPTITAG